MFILIYCFYLFFFFIGYIIGFMLDFLIILRKIWFDFYLCFFYIIYLDISGFEYVFVGEIISIKVDGFYNWI